MPIIKTPSGGTRFVGELNPGDQLASGAPTQAEWSNTTDEPAAGSALPIVPQERTAQDDSELLPTLMNSEGGAAPLMRRTSTPRTISPIIRQRNTTRPS